MDILLSGAPVRVGSPVAPVCVSRTGTPGLYPGGNLLIANMQFCYKTY